MTLDTLKRIQASVTELLVDAADPSKADWLRWGRLVHLHNQLARRIIGASRLHLLQEFST